MRYFISILQMESLVQEMQDPDTGVPVRSQKQFLTSIPAAFTGKWNSFAIHFKAVYTKQIHFVRQNVIIKKKLAGWNLARVGGERGENGR